MVKHYEGDSCPNCGRELDPLEACSCIDKEKKLDKIWADLDKEEDSSLQ